MILLDIIDQCHLARVCVRCIFSIWMDNSSIWLVVKLIELMQLVMLVNVLSTYQNLWERQSCYKEGTKIWEQLVGSNVEVQLWWYWSVNIKSFVSCKFIMNIKIINLFILNAIQDMVLSFLGNWFEIKSWGLNKWSFFISIRKLVLDFAIKFFLNLINCIFHQVMISTQFQKLGKSNHNSHHAYFIILCFDMLPLDKVW